jgi:hypothetical protein
LSAGVSVPAHGGTRARANADAAHSGSTLLYFSPGATRALKREPQACAFVQVPVYQRVNGLQIEPRHGFSARLK